MAGHEKDDGESQRITVDLGNTSLYEPHAPHQPRALSQIITND